MEAKVVGSNPAAAGFLAGWPAGGRTAFRRMDAPCKLIILKGLHATRRSTARACWHLLKAARVGTAPLL